ncbi:MAG: CbiQ family ECF transporter T component [Deltaproteobacteria bacterium]|jgi:energy-coupling factor transporter transmembrane protein EcfT|nr:CbiQ family ECF transporter T component [Deltaproteobacteria bacterium]
MPASSKLDASTSSGSPSRLDLDQGYAGAPLKCLFAAAASILALILSQPAALMALAAGALLWSSRRVRPALLLKAHLLLAAGLALCLAGSAFVPAAIGGRAATSWSLWLKMAVAPALRLTVSLNMTLALAASTPVGALARLAAALPLPDVVFTPLLVVIRFVGAFLDELALTKDAFAVRTGRRWAAAVLARPWRLWRGFGAPLIFRALAVADELALALEMKGMRRRALHWARPPLLERGDGTRLTAAAATAAVCLFLQHGPSLEIVAGRFASWWRS